MNMLLVVKLSGGDCGLERCPHTACFHIAKVWVIWVAVVLVLLVPPQMLSLPLLVHYGATTHCLIMPVILLYVSLQPFLYQYARFADANTRK